MEQKKQNCWEYMGCGREEGGSRALELGICPAASDSSFHGQNEGKNACKGLPSDADFKALDVLADAIALKHKESDFK